MCFSDQVQVWKATCLEHPESLNTYPTKPCVALSAHSSGLRVSKETKLARIQVLPRISQAQKSTGWLPGHTSHPSKTYDKNTLLALLGPSPKPSSQKPCPGLGWWHQHSPHLPNSDGGWRKAYGPQRGFWFTIYSLEFSLRDGLYWLWDRKQCDCIRWEVLYCLHNPHV